MQNKLTMGERLGDLLDEKGINAQKLSDDTGIPKATISEIISDKDKNFRYKTIVKIAEYLNVSVDYLVGMADLPSKDYDKKFINEYTGLNEKSIETLSNAKKNYDLYDESKCTIESDYAFTVGETTLFFINSLLEFDNISNMAMNFYDACRFQTREKIADNYYDFLKKGTVDSDEEKKLFLKMKSKGFEAHLHDYYGRYENDSSVDFKLFVLNHLFKDIIDEIGEKDYLKTLEEYTNIK